MQTYFRMAILIRTNAWVYPKLQFALLKAPVILYKGLVNWGTKK